MGKKCPKCGKNAKIESYAIMEFHPASGAKFKEIKINTYHCSRCGNRFSDKLTMLESGKIKNMRVHRI